VVDCLGEVALAAVMVVVRWEHTAGAQVVHLLDPLAEQAWSASGIWARKLCSVPFGWCRIGPKGTWSEPPEARSQYRGTDLGIWGFLL
jgi:hypothetical protein